MSAVEMDRTLAAVGARLDSAKSGLQLAHRLIGQTVSTSAEDLAIQREGWRKVASAGEDLIAAGALLRRQAQRMEVIDDDLIARAEGRTP